MTPRARGAPEKSVPEFNTKLPANKSRTKMAQRSRGRPLTAPHVLAPRRTRHIAETPASAVQACAPAPDTPPWARSGYDTVPRARAPRRRILYDFVTVRLALYYSRVTLHAKARRHLPARDRAAEHFRSAGDPIRPTRATGSSGLRERGSRWVPSSPRVRVTTGCWERIAAARRKESQQAASPSTPHPPDTTSSPTNRRHTRHRRNGRESRKNERTRRAATGAGGVRTGPSPEPGRAHR